MIILIRQQWNLENFFFFGPEEKLTNIQTSDRYRRHIIQFCLNFLKSLFTILFCITLNSEELFDMVYSVSMNLKSCIQT